ncbi:MAG: PfaD family polyunsaturated fatty acid/polyketide biosynthesis protein [Planctomycetes bacterium]|nr:PfaD family polyunsaturated fatty acid/polyketide biosynthesis protein [Planctomycetota bacterium]
MIGGDAEGDGLSLLAFAPAVTPEQLGDASFKTHMGIRRAYVAGAMANGIASERLVIAMGKGGMMGFFGAAGLSPSRVERAIETIQSELGDGPYGFNLIHSPDDAALESEIVELYLKREVRCVSAAAFLGLTLPLVRYRVSGIYRDEQGAVVAPNRVVAKVSRVEVARRFLSPPPDEMLTALVADSHITDEQATMAREIPVAGDITAEADSGGHTDNRPALALLPTMLALRDEIQLQYGYRKPPRVGAAGGIATPASAAAAFAMGAAYVLTGTINQACVESGTSDVVRKMLAEAGQADTMMAPAADMFEMGVSVQVLKRGTMFGLRARKLYEWYRAYPSLDKLPEPNRKSLERDYLRCTIDEAWQKTRDYFDQRDPAQVAKAERDPKHKMALIFRSYLGQSSNWANSGDASRQADFQVWCGPSMGAFNEWVRGTVFEKPENRLAVSVADNLMTGAAVLTRANILRAQGVELPPDAVQYVPRELNCG